MTPEDGGGYPEREWYVQLRCTGVCCCGALIVPPESLPFGDFRDLRVERHTIEAALRSTRGLTFRRFQQLVTLEKTCALLREEPTTTIKEVAYALGYGSPRAFGRFVRAAARLSPRELRDRIRSGVWLKG